MINLTNFFLEIKNSIYNPGFYSDLLSRPFSSSFKYFLKVVFVVYILTAVFFAIAVVPHIKNFLFAVISDSEAKYPSELVVTIDKGKASSNVTEPYAITFEGFSDSLSDSLNDAETHYDNLLVIDTTHNVDLKTARDMNSLFVLTETDLFAVDRKKGEVRAFSLKEMGDFVLNKEKIDGWALKGRDFLNTYFTLIAIVCLIFLVIFSIIGKLIYLLFASLLIWLLARIMGLHIGYKKSFQMGLHSITLPLLTLIILIPLQISYPFAVFTLILLLVTVLNIKKSSSATALSPLV